MDIAKQNPHLNGLRGIAILMVIAYHYFTGFYIFDFGWSGVDLFFILSGYLLAGRILPYLSDKKIIWKFYFNRILRIVPLYFSFLTIFYALFYLFASNETQNLHPQLQHPITFFLFVCNWMFIIDYNSNPHQLSHLWSLSVEEQFYIFFPLYLFLIKEKKTLLKFTIFIIISIILSRSINYLFLKRDIYDKIYWNTFYRMDSFFIGFIIYLLKENGFLNAYKKWIRWLLIISIFFILIGGLYEHSFRINPFFVTIGFTIIAIAYACVVILTLKEENNILKKITSNPTLIFFGKISFGLYIFHWPVYLTMFSVINFLMLKTGIVLSTNNIQLINIILSFCISALVSFLSFTYYESFFMKFKMVPNRQK